MDKKQQRQFLGNDQGFMIPILGFGFIMLVLVVTVGGAMVYAAYHERNIVQTTLESTLKNAIVTATNGPLLVTGQGTIDNTILQASINQQLNKTLSYLEPVVTMTSPPIVYTTSDKGNPAPGEIGGTIPGPCVYLELKLTWLMPPILGYRFEGSKLDKVLVSYPVYNPVNQTWVTPQ